MESHCLLISPSGESPGDAESCSHLRVQLRPRRDCWLSGSEVQAGTPAIIPRGRGCSGAGLGGQTPLRCCLRLGKICDWPAGGQGALFAVVSSVPC